MTITREMEKYRDYLIQKLDDIRTIEYNDYRGSRDGRFLRVYLKCNVYFSREKERLILRKAYHTLKYYNLEEITQVISLNRLCIEYHQETVHYSLSGGFYFHEISNYV